MDPTTPTFSFGQPFTSHFSDIPLCVPFLFPSSQIPSPQSFFSRMGFLSSTSVSKDPFIRPSICSADLPTTSLSPQTIFCSEKRLGRIEPTHLRLWSTFKNYPGLKLRASKGPPEMTKELQSEQLNEVTKTESECEFFGKIKERFLSFKRNNYMVNLELFENLSKGQAPKFMVIACADSRVCPSNILGFQPGEAFVVRNVANLVPPYEGGPSETNAALEFAVNSLQVENILVIGHSCCGGIRALMSMHDDVESSSFIGSWVSVGMNARISTKASASKLGFNQQCKHCEKESVNCSLSNLLTYPWIEEKVKEGELFIHGGYYDFVDCTFEKWTLDYEGSNLKEKSAKLAFRNILFWS